MQEQENDDGPDEGSSTEDDWTQDWDDRDPDDDDRVEEDLERCGQIPHLGGGCQNAGTEYCDFECPYRDVDLYEEPAPGD